MFTSGPSLALETPHGLENWNLAKPCLVHKFSKTKTFQYQNFTFNFRTTGLKGSVQFPHNNTNICQSKLEHFCVWFVARLWSSALLHGKSQSDTIICFAEIQFYYSSVHWKAPFNKRVISVYFQKALSEPQNLSSGMSYKIRLWHSSMILSFGSTMFKYELVCPDSVLFGSLRDAINYNTFLYW